jgi:hypothetical protein
MSVWVNRRDPDHERETPHNRGESPHPKEVGAGEQSIVDICREKNISNVTFHRWKSQFGHLDLNEAKRLKELERENLLRRAAR